MDQSIQSSPDATVSDEHGSRGVRLHFLGTLCLAGLAWGCLGDMSVATHHFPAEQSSIGLRREHSHPYLPEYQRWLMIEVNGRETKCQLPMDTGGTVRVNLYQAGPGAFVLRDRIGAYRANTAGPGQNCEEMPSPVGARFIGAFDVVSGAWSFVDGATRRELPLEVEP